MSQFQSKLRVLLIGTGGIGSITAYALETGGHAEVTAVLRSNFPAVQRDGFSIDSVVYGSEIRGWRPSHIRDTIPTSTETQQQKPYYDYIILTTKNNPDIPPSLVRLLEPAITPTTPQSSFSKTASTSSTPSNHTILTTRSSRGHPTRVLQRPRRALFDTRMQIGNHLLHERAKASARTFITAYNANGKANVLLDENVAATRWHKLIYNASFNPVSAVLRGMDVTRMRAYEHVVEELVRPAMREVIRVARGVGVDFSAAGGDDELVDVMIRSDPTETFFRPSMGQDVEKGNFMEIETIVGEPVREAGRLDIPTPTLKMLYAILKGLQVRIKEERGLIGPRFSESSRYADRSNLMS